MAGLVTAEEQHCLHCEEGKAGSARAGTQGPCRELHNSLSEPGLRHPGEGAAGGLGWDRAEQRSTEALRPAVAAGVEGRKKQVTDITWEVTPTE